MLTTSRSVARVVGEVFVALVALGWYLACAVVGALVVGLAWFLLFPDPCLPFCVAAETRGGKAEEVASLSVLVLAIVAYLAALVPMGRRRRKVGVLLVPPVALLLIVPAAVGGLLLADLLTADADVLTCRC